MTHRYAQRRDNSEAGIIARLRAFGATVTQIDGRNVADLLVAYKGSWGVAEVKTGRAKLKPGQEAWRASQAAPVAILRTPEEAEAWLRSWHPTEREIASAIDGRDSYPTVRPGNTGTAWGDAWDETREPLTAGKDLTAGPA